MANYGSHPLSTGMAQLTISGVIIMGFALKGSCGEEVMHPALFTVFKEYGIMHVRVWPTLETVNKAGF